MRNKKSFLLFLSLIFSVIQSPADDSQGIPEKGIPVLIYHKIPSDNSEAPSQTVIRLDQFKEQMKYLHDEGYTTYSIDELIQFMRGPVIPEKSVVLTFDDGWKSVKNVLPVLNEYGFKASFFIITDRGIGGEHLEWEDIIEISKNPNFEIGSHSATHPADGSNNLITWLQGGTSGKDGQDVRTEIETSKKTLEEKLQKNIKYLAWPAGWYNENLIQIAKKAGYQGLLTVDQGVNVRHGNIYKIKRVFINGACGLDIFKRVLKKPKSYLCPSETEKASG